MKAARTKRRPRTAWEAAEAYGCDMALLERNLKMTPAQRVEAHRQALELVKALRQARVIRRG